MLLPGAPRNKPRPRLRRNPQNRNLRLSLQLVGYTTYAPLRLGVEELSERQLFHVTSARYSPRKSARKGEEARRGRGVLRSWNT